MTPRRKLRITSLAGGTGGETLAQAVRDDPDVEVTFVTTSTDDGGSTGELARLFGTSSVGDSRKIHLGASTLPPEAISAFSERFDRDPFDGHNVGNLLLTRLELIMGEGSFPRAVDMIGTILQSAVRVVPATLGHPALGVRFDDGSELIGEQHIDVHDHAQKRVVTTFLDGQATLNPDAAQAILRADIVVLGPGSIYTSLSAILSQDGIPQALAETAAQVVMVSNLATTRGEADGSTALDLAKVVTDKIGPHLDALIVNNERPDEDLLARYAAESQTPVFMPEHVAEAPAFRVLECPLLHQQDIFRDRHDKVRRSVIRHDSQRLLEAIKSLVPVAATA